jgi:hypothetical protein|tara:strand:- start:97 stop:336 length:240 start_codon:yes stop_codon:yes gene_type:complete
MEGCLVWPFSTKQERQAEAMSQILAENAYERRMERLAGWVRTVVALIGGVALTFLTLFLLDNIGNVSPTEVWEWITNGE